MGLTCALRGHRVDPADTRWNANIRFGTCLRCRRALVEGADGIWQVPRGYRVVWRPAPQQAEPPAGEQVRQEQALTSAGTAEPAGDQALLADEAGAESPLALAEITEWPLPSRRGEGAVNGSRAGMASPATGPEEREEPAAHLDAADFMNDDSDDIGWGDFAPLPRRSGLG